MLSTKRGIGTGKEPDGGGGESRDRRGVALPKVSPAAAQAQQLL